MELEVITKQFTEFLKEYEAKAIPLTKQVNLSYFKATTTGKEEDYKELEELQIKLSKVYANKEDFAKLKMFKESSAVTDEILKRQLDVLYNSYAGYQIDEEKLEVIIKLETRIEKKFSTYRVMAGGKKLTDNEVDKILSTITDTGELKAAWEASKKIGKIVREDVQKLVRMRNEAARELGFDNYHEMELKLGEQDPSEIEKLFDELDELTREAFAQTKEEIDQSLAKKYRIEKKQLMPWHYQDRFFQEAPRILKVDLDKFYEDKDLVQIIQDYYRSIRLPVDDIIKRSDLFEREGKNQHAYCMDVDREGDVRVLANIKPNARWVSTMLHEFGHAVYFKFVDKALPWLLREHPHAFTTEAIAMLFGRLQSNPTWLQEVVGVTLKERTKIGGDVSKIQRQKQLVFSRWAQVMYRFEKSMYKNPDQDLNKLWWDLVERYQMLRRPEGRNEPDWASKIHIATAPVYYHNYLLGELLASQLHYHLTERVLKTGDVRSQCFAGRPEVGEYFIEKIFMLGKKYHWNEMIERATGEKLTPKYFARQFVDVKDKELHDS